MLPAPLCRLHGKAARAPRKVRYGECGSSTSEGQMPVSAGGLRSGDKAVAEACAQLSLPDASSPGSSPRTLPPADESADSNTVGTAKKAGSASGIGMSAWITAGSERRGGRGKPRRIGCPGFAVIGTTLWRSNCAVAPPAVAVM